MLQCGMKKIFKSFTRFNLLGSKHFFSHFHFLFPKNISNNLMNNLQNYFWFFYFLKMQYKIAHLIRCIQTFSYPSFLLWESYETSILTRHAVLSSCQIEN